MNDGVCQIIDTDGVLVRCKCYEEDAHGFRTRGQDWHLPWYDDGGSRDSPLHEGAMTCPDCGQKFHLEIVED